MYLQNRNKAENTVIAYLAAVRQYQSLYLEVTGDHLRLYKCYLIEHYKPQTVNVRVRAMNAYLEYLGMEEDKMMMVRHREQTYCDHVISQADYEYLKKCLVRDGNARYYFLVRFLAATGVRVSEVIQIRIGDVACGFRDLYSKDNQVRRIYIPRELREELLEWLRQRTIPGSSEIDHKGAYLFQNRCGDPMTAAAIRGQLRKFADLYGIEKKTMHPHAFRHRFAKNFLETIGDIAMLSDLLGHRNIETTRIYLRRSAAEQRQIVNRVINW
ncbi:MAG: tyrosine-type recombinase/integrase [Hungatella sp.]